MTAFIEGFAEAKVPTQNGLGGGGHARHRQLKCWRVGNLSECSPQKMKSVAHCTQKRKFQMQVVFLQPALNLWTDCRLKKNERSKRSRRQILGVNQLNGEISMFSIFQNQHSKSDTSWIFMTPIQVILRRFQEVPVVKSWESEIPIITPLPRALNDYSWSSRKVWSCLRMSWPQMTELSHFREVIKNDQEYFQSWFATESLIVLKQRTEDLRKPKEPSGKEVYRVWGWFWRRSILVRWQ